VARATINPSAMDRIVMLLSLIKHLFQLNLKQMKLKRFSSVGASTHRQNHFVMEVIQSCNSKSFELGD
jgi:hypothetical protein